MSSSGRPSTSRRASTSRSGSAYGSGLISAAWMRLNIAVLAPIPRPSVPITTRENPRWRTVALSASRTSDHSATTSPHLRVPGTPCPASLDGLGGAFVGRASDDTLRRTCHAATPGADHDHTRTRLRRAGARPPSPSATPARKPSPRISDNPRQPRWPPFRLEEATIAQIHAAMRAAGSPAARSWTSTWHASRPSTRTAPR